MKLVFLGTRGEIDVRTTRHRRHASLLVGSRGRRVMVDCGADWLGRIRQVAPDAIVLTHAHPDHASGLRDGAPCPVWATRATWRGLARLDGIDRRTLRHRRPVSIEGIEFEAFPVEHSLIAPAVGYRILAGGVTIFYVPDLVRIRQRRAALRGVRIYIGDGATLARSLVRRRDGRLIGHASIAAQLEWCAREGVSRAVFTHCGSAIVRWPHDVMTRRVRGMGAVLGVQAKLAHDGLELTLR